MCMYICIYVYMYRERENVYYIYSISARRPLRCRGAVRRAASMQRSHRTVSHRVASRRIASHRVASRVMWPISSNLWWILGKLTENYEADVVSNIKRSSGLGRSRPSDPNEEAGRAHAPRKNAPNAVEVLPDADLEKISRPKTL